MAREGRLPVVFGGEVHGNALVLTQFIGIRTALLRGLVVQPRSGLGGASMVAGRPLSVTDYRTASTITHDYDIPVLTEGIRSIVAVPVLVDGKPRAVLYAGERSGAPIGGRAAELVLHSARRLSHELRIRDEVDRRFGVHDIQIDDSRELAAAAEQVREVHAELRRLAANPTQVTGDRLGMLADRLSEALSGKGTETTATLTSRELDVLAQVALGRTNREAAQRLSLQTETVKSYLRSAAAKLDARTRNEAVVKARRARLLP